MLRFTVRKTDGTLWAATKLKLREADGRNIIVVDLEGSQITTKFFYVEEVAEIVVRYPSVVTTKDKEALEEVVAGSQQKEVAAHE